MNQPRSGRLVNIHLRRRLLISAAVAAAILIYFAVDIVVDNRYREQPQEWGVTFSPKYAEELGLDWRAVYLALLDDVKVRRFRIPVYWDRIQPAEGPYDFRDYDWMLDEAEKRGAKVMLAIGRRVPRWPECHSPAWVTRQGPAFENSRLLELIGVEVRHFRGAPALAAWQLENEPLLDLFGRCPAGDATLLAKERDLLKSLDATRPVVITDSGELSLWVSSGIYADVLGISMYRVTWNKWLGYFYYPITPAFYRNKAEAVSPFVKKVIVSELQAEPWPSGQRSLAETPLDEQYKSMNLRRFRNNIEFAKRTGFPEIYLWGAEWWYWIKGKGNPEFWDEAKKVFAAPNASP